MDLFSNIELQLKKNEFSDFDHFAESVLDKDKSNSLLATLELGLRATSISQSFALGYRCALQMLWPDFISNEWAALCVSEVQGNHPKQIKTTVNESGKLSGHKSFVSMAKQAKQLIIIAKLGTLEGRPLLKAVLVSQELDEVKTQVMPNIGMLPEISHGSIELNNAEGLILPGDGHSDYSRRFRYLEDVHVLMAFTSLILSKSMRNNLQPEIVEHCLLIISAIINLKDPQSILQDLHISALFREFGLLVSKFEAGMESLNNDFKESWKRDKKIFNVALKARSARTEKAHNYVIELLS